MSSRRHRARPQRAGLQRFIHRIGDLVGLDLTRYRSVRHPIGRRIRLLQDLNIDLVLDVGANVGQYALELRRWGYRGRIVSFEPLSGPFDILSQKAGRDDHWQAVHLALGERSEILPIHVAGNAAASSSILPMLPLHDQVAPEAAYVDVESVEVRPLDELLPEYRRDARSILLKVDVQGYESAVIRGAYSSLKEMTAVQLELSLMPLYADAPLLAEMVAILADHGFALVGLEPGLADPRNGYLLQTDGIFARINNESAREPE
jgi:FkbM family methyltransferase